jgi:hypothetical protein
MTERTKMTTTIPLARIGKYGRITHAIRPSPRGGA